MLILDGPPLRLACDRCHKRKQRCTRTGINDNKPCERCREAGSQCVYSPPSRLGRPSNKLKRERQQLSDNNGMAAGSLPSSITTSPTPSPLSSHSFSLSASSVPVPTCMSMTANGRSKTKTRRSHSTMAAASLRFKKPSSPPSISSQYSDTALSPSYHFGSPPLHAIGAVGENVSFQNFQIPRSQPQHYHKQTVPGSVVISSPEHPSTLLSTPEQQSWGATPKDHGNNMIFGSRTYDDTGIILQQQHQRQQPQAQPLYTVDTWPNLAHNPLQFQATQELPRMVGPGGYTRWKWSGQPVADPQVAMNLGIPVTMTMDGSQPMYYYW